MPGIPERKLTDAQIVLAKRDLAGGATLSKVAKQYGVSAPTLHKWAASRLDDGTGGWPERVLDHFEEQMAEALRGQRFEDVRRGPVRRWSGKLPCAR